MKKTVSLVMIILMLMPISSSAFAHSGRTDANGGHTNRRTGEYHYHNGGRSSSSSSSSSSPKTKKVTYKIAAPNMPTAMYTGESVSLEWTVDGSDRDVTWSSSNPGIVTVSDAGVLTAYKKGSAKIHASYSGSRKTWTVKVKPILVTEVEVPLAQILLRVGGSVFLDALVLPTNASDRSVVWKSSNQKVATADAAGEVTGAGAGLATVTATAKDGSKKADSVKVFVIDELEENRFPIGKGSERASVATIQTILIALGDLDGGADGSFGSKTETAVQSFQQRNGYEEGQCSYQLYTHMLDELNPLFEMPL